MLSRMSASILETLGLNELVTESVSEYENLAVSLATEGCRLVDIRECLDEAREKSEFFDTAAFTLKLERAFTEIWNKHVAIKS